jgi:hypothetical protein
VLSTRSDVYNRHGQRERAKDDGSDGKIVGGAEGRTRSLKRIDARTYEDMDKTNGKTTMTRRLVLAPDGKSATITMTGTNNDGKPVKNVVVFEKQ